MEQLDAIHSFVSGKIVELSDESYWARQTLAKLRYGIGKAPGEVPELFEVTLGGLPERLAGSGVPSVAEWAIYTVLTMYALNKTAMDENPHKDSGDSFGQAVRKLVLIDGSSDKLIKTRYCAAITASDMPGFSFHAAGLVKRFKSNIPTIRLDYPQFAVDLCKLFTGDTRKEALYKWTSGSVS